MSLRTSLVAHLAANAADLPLALPAGAQSAMGQTCMRTSCSGTDAVEKEEARELLAALCFRTSNEGCRILGSFCASGCCLVCQHSTATRISFKKRRNWRSLQASRPCKRGFQPVWAPSGRDAKAKAEMGERPSSYPMRGRAECHPPTGAV